MKYRPILFSDPMVRALLDGQKTQIHRIVKPQPGFPCFITTDPATLRFSQDGFEPVPLSTFLRRCPYGQPGDQEWQTGPMPGPGRYYVQGLLADHAGSDSRAVWVDPATHTFTFGPHDDPEAIDLDIGITRENIRWKRPGDRLWVREATVRVEDHGYIGPVYVESEDGRACLDGGLAPSPDDCTEVEPYELHIRPSIYMPRDYCRTVLEITRVRVERVQDISIEDAMAEGVAQVRPDLDGVPPCLEWRYAYEDLWNEINGAGAWDANPWVWAVDFRAVTTTGEGAPV
jgi:hypothetical protein